MLVVDILKLTSFYFLSNFKRFLVNETVCDGQFGRSKNT